MAHFLKLGPHGIKQTIALLSWARVAPIVKAMGAPSNSWATDILWAARPDAVRIWRWYFEHQDINRNGAEVLAEVLLHLRAAPCDLVELFNETAQHEWEGLDRYITFHEEATTYLESIRDDLPPQQQGMQVLGYSFSTGCPERSDWALLRRRRYGGVTVLGMHCYTGQIGFTPWHALRYRQVHEWTGGDHPPFVISECGEDAIKEENGVKGWRNLPNPTGDVGAKLLLDYDLELRKDAYVVGGTPFTGGPTKDWESFSTDALADKIELAPLAPGLTIPPYKPKEDSPLSTVWIWVSPVDTDPVTSVQDAIDRARATTPAGRRTGIVWPAVFGPWWQKDCNISIPREIAPGGPEDLQAIRDEIEAADCDFAAWVVVRTLGEFEAMQHRLAGIVAGKLCLDLEPYGNRDVNGFWHGFMEPPFDRSPELYLRTLWGPDDPGFRVGLSIAPQPSGMDPFGAALSEWLQGSNEVLPQCYWTDGAALHPDVALPLVAAALEAAGLPDLPVLPIIPHPSIGGAEALEMMKAPGGIHIWRDLAVAGEVPPADPEPEPQPEPEPPAEPSDCEAKLAEAQGRIAALVEEVHSRDARIVELEDWQRRVRDFVAGP